MIFSNSRLLSVGTKSALRDDYEATTADSELWTGDSPAYFDRDVRRRIVGDRVDEVSRDTLELPISLATILRTGIAVQFVDPFGRTQTRRVQALEVHYNPGTPRTNHCIAHLEAE